MLYKHINKHKHNQGHAFVLTLANMGHLILKTLEAQLPP